MEQVDLINKRVEQVMGDARTDSFRQRVKNLLLLQPLQVCPVLQKQMRKHLFL